MTARQPNSPPSRGARLMQGRLMRGANVHHRTTVFVQRIDPGPLRELRVSEAGGTFARRFIEQFGELESSSPGGCLPQATRVALAATPGPCLLEALLEAILAVERFAAYTMRRLDPPRFARIVHSSSQVDLVWESHAAWVSRASAHTALVGFIELLPVSSPLQGDAGPDFATAIAKLRKRARRRQWSPTTAVIAHAAKRRGLSHELLAGSYLRIGEGVRQQMVPDNLSDLVPDRHVPNVAPAGDAGPPTDTEQLHDLLVVGGAMVSAVRYPAHPMTRDDGSEIKGPPIPVTNCVHESISDAAVLATLRHDRTLASVALVTDDITRSCRHGRGRVTAIKPPELFLHASLEDDRTQRVGDAVLNLIFPAGLPAAIPTALLVGERRTRSIARNLDRVLRAACEGVGLTTRDHTTIQGRPIDPSSLGRRHGAAFLLGDPRVAIVVSTVSPRTIVTRGLQVDRSSVTAILDPLPGNDRDVYREAVRVSVGAASDAVIVGAGNPEVEGVLDVVEAARVLLVTRRRRHPVALRHTANGGCVVFLHTGRHGPFIRVRRGTESILSLSIHSRHARQTDLTGPTLEKALYTVALVRALGVPAKHLAGTRLMSSGGPSRAARTSSVAGRSRSHIRSDVAFPGTRHELRLAGNSL